MKKVIAILMVLMMVSGVMFAAVDTLTINANAAGVLKHGFSSAKLTSYGDVVSNSSGFLATDSKTVVFADVDVVTGVATARTDEQPIGFYSIASNTRLALTVTVTAPALVSTNLVNSTMNYYVPYTLKFAGNETFSGTHGTARGPLAAAPAAVVLPIKTSSYITGSYWDSFAMTLQFADLTTGGGLDLPEDSYSAEITITVTAS